MKNEIINENINHIITALRSKGIKKKLSDIEEYINEQFPDANCMLEDKDDLSKYCNLAFEQKDYDNIMYIINQSYPLGDPYFLYTFKFCEGKNLNDLKKVFDQFIVDKTISDEDEEYIIKDYKITTSNPDCLLVLMKYEYYYIRKKINGEVERLGVKRYGEVSYTFKPNINLLCIRIGERAIAKVLEKILIKHFYNIIHIHHLKLSEPSIKYDGPNDANKTTIFLLHLITKFLLDDSHSILSHTKVGFKNPSAARLKTLVVSGTNLLNDDAVADQVKNFATLKNIDMQISWVYDKQGNNAVLTTFSLYTEGIIKIVIRDDITNEHFATDIVEYIYQKILGLMNIKIEIKTSSVMEHYFADVLSRRKTLNSYLLDGLKEKLLSDKVLSQYHVNIEKIIEEYKEIS